jgi:6-phospho-3-hexuloisomerase
VTAQPQGEVPTAADVVIYLRAQTMADDKGGASVLPMGSLYEAAMLIFFDIVSIVLRERSAQTMEGMRARHTNLE